MNVLVIGCGRLGSRLAGILDEQGHDVTVVDADPDSFHNLKKDFSGITIVGMPMDIKALRNAGVEGCDAMAVVTPDDNLNITVSQMAREFFWIDNVVARISDPLRENVFKSFGLKTVCPTKLAGDAISTALTLPWESKTVTLGTSTATFHIKEVDYAHDGIRLSEVPKDDGEVIFGVIASDGQMTLCRGGNENPVLEEGDRVVLASVID
ncbi:F420-dependent NADP oxidoreductase [Clostridium sp. W14A]|nr:F420-dependent NADP oxidoreductase [Clostridium sp. W14A]